MMSLISVKTVVACNSCNKAVTMRLPVIGCAMEGGSTVHTCTYQMCKELLHGCAFQVFWG